MEYLYNWLDDAVSVVSSIETLKEYSNVDKLNKIAIVGRHIFRLDENTTVSDVYTSVTRYFEFDDLYNILCNSTEAAIEACLICAVSKASDDRALFVESIMNMASEDQALLMCAIKRNLSQYVDVNDDIDMTEDNNDLSDNDKTVIYDANSKCNFSTLSIDKLLVGAKESNVEVNEFDDKNLSIILDEEEIIIENNSTQSKITDTNMRRSVHESNGRGSIYGSNIFIASGLKDCKGCLLKDNNIKELKHNLEIAITNERENESKLKGEIAFLMNKLVDSELFMVESEEKVKIYQQKVNESIKRISELEESVKDTVQLNRHLHQLRDEIDVLRPQADRAEIAERQFDRMKEKLDELNCVKKQLATESTALKDTHKKLIVAEQELDALKKTKLQLEDYRTQQAECTIKIDELTIRLRQRDEDIQRLLQDNQSLNLGQSDKLIQAQYLMDELRATSEQLRNVENGDGIGMGLSELNPVLMQELHSLRAENEILHKKVDFTSIESLNKLENDLADQKCINNSLQQKCMATKDSLAVALAAITTLTNRVKLLETDIKHMNRISAEVGLMYNEEMLAKDFYHAKRLRYLNKYHETSKHLLVQGNMTIRNSLMVDLSQLKETLNMSFSEVEALISKKHSMTKRIIATNDRLVEETNKHDNDNVIYKRKLEEITKETHITLEKIQSENDDKIKKMIQEHANQLSNEIEKARSLSSDIEEERIKRRRVEREKKFHEAESHRHKTQLQIGNGGGTGMEVDFALKELKQMQLLLDTANAEIHQLKAMHVNESESKCITRVCNFSDHENNIDNHNMTKVSSRPLRVKMAERSEGKTLTPSISNLSSTTTGVINGRYSTYLEQSDVMDRRVEQLTRERREMIAKNLEENKERVELNQKLLASEREITSMKSKITKLTLDNERLQRKIILSNNDNNSVDDTENEQNVRKSLRLK